MLDASVSLGILNLDAYRRLFLTCKTLKHAIQQGKEHLPADLSFLGLQRQQPGILGSQLSAGCAMDPWANSNSLLGGQAASSWAYHMPIHSPMGSAGLRQNSLQVLSSAKRCRHQAMLLFAPGEVRCKRREWCRAKPAAVWGRHHP